MTFAEPGDPALPLLVLPEGKLPTRLEPFTDSRPRYLFYKALEEHTPEVLEHLRDNVLPVYQNLSVQIAEKSYAHIGLRPMKRKQKDKLDRRGLDIEPGFNSDLPVCWWEVEQGASKTPEASALYKAIREWSETFRLSDEWLLDLALHTLFHWTQRLELEKPIALRWHRLPFEGMGLFDGLGEEFVFRQPGWNLNEGDWYDCKKRLQQAFKDFLDRHHRQTVVLAVRGGWSQGPKIVDTRERFKWLALWQVKGWSAIKILGRCHLKVKPSNVEKQVKASAKQAGVTLRLSRRGRRENRN
jgi:hypothetical protein